MRIFASAIVIVYEPGRLLGDVVEGFKRHRIDRVDFECLNELSALTLSYRYPCQLIEPTSQDRQQCLIDTIDTARLLRSAVSRMVTGSGLRLAIAALALERIGAILYQENCPNRWRRIELRSAKDLGRISV